MARPRKTLDNQKGNLTVAQQEQKKAEEKAIANISRELLEKIPRELRDKVAKDTWKRIIPDLLKLSVICNLDRDNIIGYCNAWSLYIECTKSISDENEPDVNRMWMISQKDAAAEQRRYGAMIGMDVNARLKIGTAKVKKEDEEIIDLFGEI